MARGGQARLRAGDARAAPEGARGCRSRARWSSTSAAQAVCSGDECRSRQGDPDAVDEFDVPGDGEAEELRRLAEPDDEEDEMDTT